MEKVEQGRNTPDSYSKTLDSRKGEKKKTIKFSLLKPITTRNTALENGQAIKKSNEREMGARSGNTQKRAKTLSGINRRLPWGGKRGKKKNTIKRGKEGGEGHVGEESWPPNGSQGNLAPIKREKKKKITCPDEERPDREDIPETFIRKHRQGL